MTKSLCSNSPSRKSWAVSLCFAAAVLMSLEALHPGGCVWMGLNNDQSFNLSAAIATVAIFCGSFILTQIVRSDLLNQK